MVQHNDPRKHLLSSTHVEDTLEIVINRERHACLGKSVALMELNTMFVEVGFVVSKG
jgi:hypothetical protein